MELGENDGPSFAFAMYASTAATVAVVALKKLGLLQDPIIQQLVTNLTLCRQIAGSEPRLIEHAELLTDMLLGPSGEKPKQG